MGMNPGWQGEPNRHNLARLGIKTETPKPNPDFPDVKILEPTEEYLDRTQFYQPTYTEYGTERYLSRKQNSMRKWLEMELWRERERMVNLASKILYVKPEVVKNTVEKDYIAFFWFGSDDFGRYVCLQTQGHAYDVLYLQNGGEFHQWKDLCGAFHKRFEKKFNTAFSRKGAGIMKAYFGGVK
jgi:hypothetical protein